MFDKRRYLYAVCEGKSDTLSSVPDEVFSSGMLGVGYAIEPKNGKIHAPTSGVIGNIAKSRHAYTLTTKDGVDILIHVGVDTVSLDGRGFDVMVKTGQEVKAGDMLASVDLDTIKEAGLPTVVIVLITNTEIVHEIEYDLTENCTKDDALISYKINATAGSSQ